MKKEINIEKDILFGQLRLCHYRQQGTSIRKGS